MIIQSLVRRYEASEAVPPGWQRREANFALDISENGELLGVVPLGEHSGKKAGSLSLILPSIGFGRAGKNAHETVYFLCDDGNYLLGLDPKKFESARKSYTALLDGVASPAASAICAYFARESPQLPEALSDKKPEQLKFVFQVNGRRVDYENYEIRAVWNSAQISSGELARCLASGELDNIVRLHYKVSLPGITMNAQPLISMNEQTSFRSYGAVKSDPPAQIGGKAAFAYATALNNLLKSPDNHRSVGGDTLIYWAEDGFGEEEKTFSLLGEPKEADEDKLNAIVANVASGKAIDDTGINFDSKFYLLCLSPNAARMSVRFFYVDAFGKIIENILEHYRNMEIAKAGNDKFRYLPPWVLLSETTVKKSAQDAAPLLGGQLLHAIISGGTYPLTLYQAILARARAGEDINKTKAAIIKAVLIKNYNEREVTTVALNPNSDNKPYVLGRLFSVLEQLQQRSSGGGLNTTIRDRYFSSACANPGSVFPTILKLSMHHAAKLDNAVFYEKLKTELLGKLDADTPFPSALTLDDQGRFILGYYHQTQDFFTSRKDKEEHSNEQ